MTLDEHAPAVGWDLDVRGLLAQTQLSLDAAVDVVRSDPNAALDDILAARLLVSTLLLKLDSTRPASPDGATSV